MNAVDTDSWIRSFAEKSSCVSKCFPARSLTHVAVPLVKPPPPQKKTAKKKTAQEEGRHCRLAFFAGHSCEAAVFASICSCLEGGEGGWGLEGQLSESDTLPLNAADTDSESPSSD